MLVLVLFLQTLLLIAVAAVVGFFSREIITINARMEQLREQAQDMKEQFDQANETDISLHLNSMLKPATILEQVINLHSLVNILNTTTIDQLNNLHSSVNTLNTTTLDQQSYLQSSVDTLAMAHNSTHTQVISLQSSLNTLTTQQATTFSQVTSLQSLMQNLTNRINSSGPVELYEGCVERTTACALFQSSNDYWRTCRTDPLYSDPSVSSLLQY